MKHKNLASLAAAAIIGLSVVGLAAGCTGNTAASQDQSTVNKQLGAFEQSQPVPFNNWSQYRQTLIDIEQAQIHGVATTSFFFNQGVQDPYMSCPSIGFPVASTSQLTNPTQVSNGGGNQNTSNENVTIDQSEPNGAYTGQSTGTYVICVLPNGSKEPQYAEQFVHTVGGAAHWDQTTHQVVPDGAATVATKTGK